MYNKKTELRKCSSLAPLTAASELATLSNIKTVDAVMLMNTCWEGDVMFPSESG